MEYRTIKKAGESIGRPGGNDFKAFNVSSHTVGVDIDPILSIDHFEIRKPKF